MSKQTSFIERVLQGRAQISEIDDIVETWHAGASAVALRDYLGMTDEEYSLWLQNPEMLSLICAARGGGRSLVRAVGEEAAALPSGGARESLQRWLRTQGVEA